MTTSIRTTLSMAAMLLMACHVSLAAQPPKAGKVESKKKASKSLDDQLDKQLEDDLLGGLDDIPAKKNAKKPNNNPQQAGEDIPLRPRQESPLLRIGRQMRNVEERIAEGKSGKATQELQQQILAELDKIIEQTCKKCAGGAGGKSRPGQKPGSASGEGKGTGQVNVGGPEKSTQRLDKGKAENAELSAIQKTIYRVWGHLPPQEQKSMRSSAAEKFLPKYRQLIVDYYKRLAEAAANTP